MARKHSAAVVHMMAIVTLAFLISSGLHLLGADGHLEISWLRFGIAGHWTGVAAVFFLVVLLLLWLIEKLKN